MIDLRFLRVPAPQNKTHQPTPLHICILCVPSSCQNEVRANANTPGSTQTVYRDLFYNHYDSLPGGDHKGMQYVLLCLGGGAKCGRGPHEDKMSSILKKYILKKALFSSP